MKKLFLLLLFCAALFFEFSCNKTDSPLQPNLPSSIKAKDLGQSPTPVPTYLGVSECLDGEPGIVNNTCSGLFTLQGGPWNGSTFSSVWYSYHFTIPPQAIGPFTYSLCFQGPASTVEWNGHTLYLPQDAGTNSYAAINSPNSPFSYGDNSVSIYVYDSSSVQINLCYSYQAQPTFTPTNTAGSLTATPTSTPTFTSTFSPTSTPTVTSTPTCPGAGYVNQNIVAYSQFDPRWQATPMDHCIPTPTDRHTIRNDGCFMTCFSMFSGENPGQFDETMTANGRIDSRTGNFNYIGAASDMGLEVSGTIIQADQNDVGLALGRDSYVIAALQHSNGREHYVLVTGVGINPRTNACDFRINDPAGNHQFLSDYEVDSSNHGATLDMVVEINSKN